LLFPQQRVPLAQNLRLNVDLIGHARNDASVLLLDIALADVTDIAKNLKVFEYRLTTFAPWFYVIDVQGHTVAWSRSAHPTSRAIPHED
jgi:hypothetical protein